MPLRQVQEQFTLKSFTRNQSSLPANVADKRWEALVKKEMIEHQHVISCHNKEMQALRDALSLAMEKFKSISDRNEKDLEEFKAQSTSQIKLLKDGVKANEVLIRDQRKMIEDLHQEILAIYVIYATKSDIENLKSNLTLEMKANTISHMNTFQDFQREGKILIQSLKNDLVKLTLDMEQKLAQLSERGESNFSIATIDKVSVLKEVRVYQKDIFTIEKKIENIYTLIERINKRGHLCHKPA